MQQYKVKWVYDYHGTTREFNYVDNGVGLRICQIIGITKKIFMWCNTCIECKNWNYTVKSYLTSINKLLCVDIEKIIDKERFLNDVKESTENAK